MCAMKKAVLTGPLTTLPCLTVYGVRQRGLEQICTPDYFLIARLLCADVSVEHNQPSEGWEEGAVETHEADNYRPSDEEATRQDLELAFSFSADGIYSMRHKLCVGFTVLTLETNCAYGIKVFGNDIYEMITPHTFNPWTKSGIGCHG